MRGGNTENLAICKISPTLDSRNAATICDLYDLSYEARSGIICTTVRGFWAIEDADLYFAQLGTYIEAVRRKSGNVLVLVDRRGSPVQSPEVAARMQRASHELYEPVDRLAIVVDSGLLQMQLRRLFKHSGSRVFLSNEPALAWLTDRRQSSPVSTRQAGAKCDGAGSDPDDAVRRA